MSPALKNNNWQPTSTLQQLQLRATFMQTIRQFFAERDVLEVETPLLCQHTVTDCHIESFSTPYKNHQTEQTYYLQTSPEYAMKRLLAAGSGPIFQICKAFRNGEAGQKHNPEFTMLEWYRPDFNYSQLIDEIDALLQILLKTESADRLSYQECFQHYLHIDPFNITLAELHKHLQDYHLPTDNIDFDTALQLLMADKIEPQLGKEKPIFIYHFPASQAALAKLDADDKRISERFEAYYKSVEVANGWTELGDANEQQQRFKKDQAQRQQLGKPIPQIDQRLLAALKHGLPNCAGVAIGLDRLLMLKTGSNNIREVMSFAWDNA